MKSAIHERPTNTICSNVAQSSKLINGGDAIPSNFKLMTGNFDDDCSNTEPSSLKDGRNVKMRNRKIIVPSCNFISGSDTISRNLPKRMRKKRVANGNMNDISGVISKPTNKEIKFQTRNAIVHCSKNMSPCLTRTRSDYDGVHPECVEALNCDHIFYFPDEFQHSKVCFSML